MTISKFSANKFSSLEQFNAALSRADKQVQFCNRKVVQTAKDAETAKRLSFEEKRTGGISHETANIVAQTKAAFGNAQIEAKKAIRQKEYLASIRDELTYQVHRNEILIAAGVREGFRSDARS